MSLHAHTFFTEHLALPFDDSTVIGDVYYANPQPDSPLRLRIEFADTIRVREYGGLRLAVLHPEQGEIDTVHLAFADHASFARRDANRGIGPGWDGYARIRDWHNNGEPPWRGADVNGLRRATVQYARIWFPQSRRKPAALSTTPAKSAHQVPAAAHRTGPRTR